MTIMTMNPDNSNNTIDNNMQNRKCVNMIMIMVLYVVVAVLVINIIHMIPGVFQPAFCV